MMPVVTAVSVCPTCAVPVIVGAPVAGLLTTTVVATWKSAESPYRGRFSAFGPFWRPLRGPWSTVEESGRP